MSELDKEKDQFLLQVRDDFIDIITRQVEFEEKARQYRLIFQLAEKYRQADPKSISEFIDSEKKNAEKEKNSVRTNVTNLKQANESINSRKSFIPMLELEYCILTTTDIPESLNMNLSFKNNRNAIDFDFNSKDTDKRENIKKLFETPFDNIVAEIFISEQKQKITHAQVIITSLAFLPENWPIFLAEFKNNYKEVEKNRYSLLYFLTTWFEMRPKHFLKMFPHLIDLIEECDDSDLLIKHLKIIFDFSKRNMHFSFLPLDSIPSTFRLNYIQTSDYHKLISGSDATTMQNSFKSNMLKRFDLTNKKFCGESDGEEEKNPAPKGKKKKNNTTIPIPAPTPAPAPAATANNSNNDNDNQNKNQTKNDYPQQPNLQDFADAIIILITTIQNALSLDCFIPEKTEDLNISESNDVYKNFHEINYQSTKHLKYLFTESEFDYWKEKINTIEVAKKGIQKLKAILEGFSNWFVEVLNSQKQEKNPVFNTINNNFTKLFNKVKEIDENIAENFLKVDLNEVDQEVKNKIPKDIYQYFEKIDKPAKDWPQIPDCFFSDEQRSYKSQENHNITLGDKNHNKYSDLQNLTQNIMYILGIRPKIKSIHMEKYDYEIIQKNFNSENHNDKAQQYIDPWAIRTIFYNFTRFIFSDKYKNFKFQI